MRTNTELAYSNDLCSAFLTAIVKSFEAQHPGKYLGRTAMQKLTYFAKVLDVPVPCSFGIYTFGPYSDTITFAVESLLADDVLVDRSAKPSYSNYRTGSNSGLLLGLFRTAIEPYQNAIDKVVEVLGAFGPDRLELIATLHFVARRQRQRVGTLDKTAIVAEFKSIKKNKFSDDEIEDWYAALEQAKLIQPHETEHHLFAGNI
jgi:uncharacterized protein YwgA